MARFVEIAGECINVDTIQSYYFSKDKRLHIAYTNGETETYDCSRYSTQYIVEQLRGEHSITQVIPCTEPYFGVWKDEGETHFATPVKYLGLTAAGCLEPVELNDEGYFEKMEAGNFLGVYRKDRLLNFPELSFLREE